VKSVVFVIVSAILMATLSGCAVFKPAGVADYAMEPIVVDGVAYCCKVTVYNTKDIGMVDLVFTKTDDNISVKLTELEVSSSDPAMIQAETTRTLVDQLLRISP
jgi:hypothetical protein|tara:strand:- start:438 stop:749 length:312 start_codon:yes stop_codon:yes gene_type:complete